MAGIDAALHRLQPVAVLQPLRGEGLLRRHAGEFEFRQAGLMFRRPHIGPQHAATLHQRIGAQLDAGGGSRSPPAPTAGPRTGRSRRISSRDRRSAGRIPRCGRTTARRGGGRRIPPAARSGPACRGTRSAFPTEAARAPEGRRSRAVPRPAGRGSSSAGTSRPSAFPGPVRVSRSFCSWRSMISSEHLTECPLRPNGARSRLCPIQTVPDPDCPRSRLSPIQSVIASAAKQSPASGVRTLAGDCFAALAMTLFAAGIEAPQ